VNFVTSERANELVMRARYGIKTREERDLRVY